MFAFLFSLWLTGSPVWASDDCRKVLGKRRTLSAELSALLTIPEPPKKYSAALGYIFARHYSSTTELVGELDLFFTVIRDASILWDFRKIHGRDGSVYYVGKYGPALIVRPNGEILRSDSAGYSFEYGTLPREDRLTRSLGNPVTSTR